MLQDVAINIIPEIWWKTASSSKADGGLHFTLYLVQEKSTISNIKANNLTMVMNSIKNTSVDMKVQTDLSVLMHMLPTKIVQFSLKRFHYVKQHSLRDYRCLNWTEGKLKYYYPCWAWFCCFKPYERLTFRETWHLSLPKAKLTPNKLPPCSWIG